MNKPQILIDQSKDDNEKYTYGKVQYYVNFNDLMYSKSFAEEISHVLTFFIREKEKEIKKITKVIIPYDGNFILGFEVGQNLGKSLIKIRPKDGKIEKDKPWEGTLDFSDQVIIIHDVLVTGDQILEAINKIRKKCKKIIGIYCLIRRKDFPQNLEKLKGFKVESILEVNDDDIKTIRGEK